jgi:hypothetical protein
MSKPDIGATVAIASGLPTAFTEVGYEAMTWVNITGVLSFGEIGDENSAIDVPGDLATGRARTEKGEVKGTTSSIVCREIKTDAGQIALIAAAGQPGATGEFSLRIGDPGAATAPEAYISGYVMNYIRNERSTTSYAGFKCDFVNNYGVVAGT